MKRIDGILTIMSIIISALSWFMLDFSLELRIITVLGILFITLLACAIRVSIYNKRLVKNIKEIQQKHIALSRQFDDKTYRLQQYERGVIESNYVLSVALSRAKESNLKSVYGAIRNIFNNITREDR